MKDWRAMLKQIGGDENEMTAVNSSAVREMIDEIEQLRVQRDELATALRRIGNMTDRDGNAIEMHLEELRGIARAAYKQADIMIAERHK